MNFDTFGPYEFPRDREPGERWKHAFWEEARSQWEGYEDIDTAIGCYVFSMEWNGKPSPWYVGQTQAQTGFRGEIFQPHKISHYENILAQKKRGKATITLFPLMTPSTWSFSKDKSHSETIDWLEKTLIAMALKVNPDIQNTASTKLSRSVYVSGVLGHQLPGRRNHGSNYARQIFGG